MLKRLLIAALLCGCMHLNADAQKCGNCKVTPSVAQFDLDVQVPRPELKGEETKGWVEYIQLFHTGRWAESAVHNNNVNCVRFNVPIDTRVSDESFMSKEGAEIPPLNEESQIMLVGLTYTNLPPPGDLSRFGDYLMTGSIRPSGDGYVLHMELQAACDRTVVTSADIPFQSTTSSEYSLGIAQQAAAAMSPLIDKINQFELKQRQANNITSLASPLPGAINIKPKKRKLMALEETELEITFKDCDGLPLPHRQISFTRGELNGNEISEGTLNGTVTPSVVTTDANGKAKARFKMGKEKSAIIKAYHIYNKPSGCADVKLGSAVIGTLPTPVLVALNYVQMETHFTNRFTLPGVKIKGGAEEEQTTMFHTCEMYYFPTDEDLKNGFLVNAESKDSLDTNIRKITESGYYTFTKKVEDAFIMAMVGDKPFVQAKEEGSKKTINGLPGANCRSEIVFFKGDGKQPGSFMWVVEYPAQPEGEIAYGSVMIMEDDTLATWEIKPVTDPESPYKFEYLLSLREDVAKEMKAGEEAMKALFGFDINDLSKAIDPTNPQTNAATAIGSRTIFVRILSPYNLVE